MGQYYMSQFEYILFFRKGYGKKINNCGTADILSVPNKKTKDENGIQLSYDGNAIQANGILALIEGQTEGGKGSEIATCEFNASMTPEDVSGSGLFTLTADYRVGQSKLELLSGCTAELAIRNGVMDPIKFNGKYQYGHVGGAGQDGQEAQTAVKKAATKMPQPGRSCSTANSMPACLTSTRGISMERLPSNSNRTSCIKTHSSPSRVLPNAVSAKPW